MKVLAIDTSAPRAVVALVTETSFTHRFLDEPRRHAELLPDAIQSVLEEAGISFHALTGVASGIGPGSFVGIRIALSTAKGIASARQIPIHPFCSLSAYVSDEKGKITVITDARRNEFFVASFEVHENGPEILDAPKTIPVTSESGLDTNQQFIRLQPGPSPDGVAARVRESLSSGPVDLHTLAPNYARSPDAKAPKPSEFSVLEA